MFDDEMLTIEELAAYLKLRPQTIYKWAQTGKVPGAKFGKEWRFRRSTIEKWIESRMPAFPGPHGENDRPAGSDHASSLPRKKTRKKSPDADGDGASKN